MPTKIIHLKRHTSGHLLIVAQICVDGTPRRLTRPLLFVVDTASERTFITPDNVEAIEKVTGPLVFDPKNQVSAQTMVGSLTYEAFQGFSLTFECIDADLVTLCPYALCFADPKGPLAAALRAGKSKKSPDGLQLNVLGRDILNQVTLIVPPRAGDAFLACDFDIMPTLRELWSLRPYFDHLDEAQKRSQVQPLPALSPDVFRVFETDRSVSGP